MAGIREKNQNIMICFTGKVEDKGEGWGFGCAACGAVPQYHTWTMVPAQSKLLSLIAHSKWCCWRPRRDVSWTTALAVGGLNGVWNKAAQRGASSTSTPKPHRRQCVSLHLGAHLIHTPPNLHPHLFALSGLISHKLELKIRPFPQNKLSLLSSCSSEVQDVLGEPALGGHPSVSKEGPGERW